MVATPTPTPTPTYLLTLKQPQLISSTRNGFQLSIELEVTEPALGAFIEIKSLGINRSNSSIKKDSKGRVVISVQLPETNSYINYDVYLFSFGDGTESPCCSDIGVSIGNAPRDPNRTGPNSSPDVKEYLQPPIILSTPTTQLTPSIEFEDLSKCRLPDGDPQLSNMTVGFPLPLGRVDLTKPTKVQILPVSFSDVPADTNPTLDYANGMGAMKNFWSSQSSIGSVISIVSPKTYKKLLNPVLSYDLASSLFGFQSEKYASFVKFVIQQYESEIDFTDVSTVVVVVPLKVTTQQIGTWVVDTQHTFNTNEGVIYNYMLTGNGESKNGFGAWVHEYGHALGLTDMRFVDSLNSTIQRPEGLGVFDVMGSGNAAPEILVWSRFLLNILAAKQILCISNASTSVHWIRPLPKQTKELKGLIIPTGTYTAVVIESRRSYGYDSYLAQKDQGVLVYTIDTRIPYKRSPAQIIQPTRSQDKEWYTDSALRLNEFVATNGWKVSVVESGDFGDVVKVEKVG